MATSFIYNSEITAPNESASTYPSLRQTWGLVGVFLLMQLPAALPTAGFAIAAQQLNMPILDTIGKNLAYVVAMGLTIGFAFYKRRSRQLAWATTPLPVYVIASLGLLAMGVLAEPLVSAIPMTKSLQELVRANFNKNVVFSAVLAAPVLEEVLFRGIILDGLLKRYTPAASIIWSAVVFGVIHIIPNQAVNAALLGIGFGWIYYRTRSLWLCIFLHFFNNTISALTLLFNSSIQMDVNTTRNWIGNDGLYGGLLLLCLGICISSYAYLNRALPKSL